MLKVQTNRGYLIGQELKHRPATGRQYILERALSKAIDSLLKAESSSENQILATIAQGIAEALSTGRAMIYLLDEKGKIQASEGYRMSREESHNHGKLPTEIMKIAVEQKIPVYIPDLKDKHVLELRYKNEPLLNPEVARRNVDRFGKNFRIREKMDMAVVPLIVEDKVIGLIRVDSWNRGRSILKKSMDPESFLSTLQNFAYITAHAIRHERQVRALTTEKENLRRTYIELRTYFETVIHDVNNQLTGPIGFLELVQTRGRDISAEACDQYIARARGSLKKTQQVTRSTLDMIRGRGKLSLGNIEMALFDLSELIFSEAKEFGNIKFELVSIQLRSDQGRVAMAFREYLANARKYSPVDSELIVKTEVIENQLGRKFVKVSVTDKGEGFKEEDKDKIFQGERVTKSDAKGYGLGLKNIRTLIYHLGGQIGAESAGPGQGSIFWFTLPLESPTGSEGI